MKRVLHLYYSNIGSIPALGYLYYIVQLLCLRLNWTDRFYVCKRDKKYDRGIFLAAEKCFDIIECRTFQIGHPLVTFSKRIELRLDSKDMHMTRINNKVVYNQVVWTLVSVTGADMHTKKIISSMWGNKISDLIPSRYIL